MIISLSDQRLTAIATDALDGSDAGLPTPVGIPVAAAGISVRRDGEFALFKVGELPNGTPIEIPVVIESGSLVFFPERCASQRQVLAMLGIND